MATGLSLVCGDCGLQLRSTKEAQEHAETVGHTNFSESTEPETDLHTKRTGHSSFSDKTQEAAKPIQLTLDDASEPSPTVTPAAGAEAGTSSSGDAAQATEGTVRELVVPSVNAELKAELEDMGFSAARAVRALHYCGTESVEAAVNWIVEHEADPDVDTMPMVSAGEDATKKPALSAEEARAKAQELVSSSSSSSSTTTTTTTTFLPVLERCQAFGSAALLMRQSEGLGLPGDEPGDEALGSQGSSSGGRIRAGRELLEAKRIEEDFERKRIIAARKAEKDEEKRARERIKAKLEEDRDQEDQLEEEEEERLLEVSELQERRRKLGLPPEEPKAKDDKPPPTAPVEVRKPYVEMRPATKAEQMRTALRTLKTSHKEDEAKVKRAFETLLKFVGNVARSPDEEKFRRIRVTNPAFQERVGSMQGGVDFLELCGFKFEEGDEFLVLARESVDSMLLNTAGSELTSAITNPYFGVL
eukprot:jgi/Mesen1/4723/ME000241S03758